MMTDDQTPIPNPTPTQTPPATSDRRTRIALAVSVALNLGVAGVVAGALLSGGDGHHGPTVRDVGFGFFSEALTPGQREALRQRFVAANPRVLSEWTAMRADVAAVLAALRAEPFHPAALQAALDRQSQHWTERLTTGQSLIEDFLLALSADQRSAFADRLEDQMRFIDHPGKGRDGDGEGEGD